MRDLFVLWLRSVLTRLPGEKNNAPSAGFEKKIDWSMFQHGMSLPNAFHEAALAHLSSPLERGDTQKVRLETDGGVFEARIGNVKFSNGCSRDVIRILWGKKSPIAQYFQSKYKTLFEAMVRDDDKSVIDALAARVMIECADEKGVFRICSIGSEEKSDIVNAHKANDQKKVYEEKTVVKKAEATMQSASSKNLAADIRRHYPNGFDFSDNAMRLVESRCGTLSQKETAAVQRMMYKQRAEVWFFPEQILEPLQQAKLLVDADNLLVKNSYFSLSWLISSYGFHVKHLESESDQNRFVEYILSRHRTDICFEGDAQDRLCILETTEFDTVCNEMAQKIHYILHESASAVPLANLHESFPNVSKSFILSVCMNNLADVVVEDDGNGGKSLQLLEFYYLPDNFCDTLKQAIESAKVQNISPTMSQMSECFDKCYGDNFAENYALTNDEVFHQVISLVYRRIADMPARYWKGNAFLLADTNNSIVEKQKRKRGVVAAFLEYFDKTSNDPYFTEEEFFAFTQNVWGLKCLEVVRIGYLRDSAGDDCVLRLNQKTWTPKKKFLSESNWSDEIAANITTRLNSQLGLQPYLPIVHLSSAFYDSLPDVVFAGDVVKWNAYILVSVIKNLLPGVRIANDSYAYNGITAFLCPYDADISDEAEYVLRILKASGDAYSSVEEVFKKLKEDHVRLTLKRFLRNTIQSIMGV